MLNPKYKGFTILVVVCALVVPTFAAQVKSDKDGVWSDPTIWDTDALPLPEDDVWILTDVVQDVNVLGKTNRVFNNGGNFTIPFNVSLETAAAGLVASGSGNTIVEGNVKTTKLQNWSSGQLTLKAGAIIDITTSPSFRIDSGSNNNRITFDNESPLYDLTINATGNFLIMKGANLKFIADPNYGFYSVNTPKLQINNHAALVKIEVDFNGYPVPKVGDPDIVLIDYVEKQIAAGNEIESAVVVENANQAFEVVDNGSAIVIRAVPTGMMIDVLGMDVDPALAEIAAAGFEDVSVVEEARDTIPAGTVVGQNIDGDLYVPADSPVVLTVSTGKQRGWTWASADVNDPNNADNVLNWIANTDDSVWPSQDYDDVNDLVGDRLFVSSGEPVWNDSGVVHGDGLIMTGGSLTILDTTLDVAPGLWSTINEGGFSQIGYGEPNGTTATLTIGSGSAFVPRAVWIGMANAFDDTLGDGHVIVEGNGVLSSQKWIALAPKAQDTIFVGDDDTADELVPSGLLEIRGSQATVETYSGWFELNSPNAEVRFVADANGFSVVKSGADGGTRGLRLREGLISVDFNGYQEVMEADLGDSGFIELLTYEASKDINDSGCMERSSALLPEGWTLAIQDSADEFEASRKAVGLQWNKPVAP